MTLLRPLCFGAVFSATAGAGIGAAHCEPSPHPASIGAQSTPVEVPREK